MNAAYTPHTYSGILAQSNRHARIHINTHARAHTHTHISTHANVQIHTHTNKHTHARTHTLTHIQHTSIIHLDTRTAHVCETTCVTEETMSQKLYALQSCRRRIKW